MGLVTATYKIFKSKSVSLKFSSDAFHKITASNSKPFDKTIGTIEIPPLYLSVVSSIRFIFSNPSPNFVNAE